MADLTSRSVNTLSFPNLPSLVPKSIRLMLLISIFSLPFSVSRGRG